MTATRARLHPWRTAGVLWRRVASALEQRATEQERARFVRSGSDLLASAPRRVEADPVVAFCHSGFLRHAGLHALLGRRLADRGALPLYVLDDIAPPELPHPDLRAIEGGLVRRSRTLYLRRAGARQALSRRWEVDLPAGVCAAGGINFAPAVLGALRRDFRCYRPDHERPEVKAETEELVESADATLDVCLALRELARRGRRVRVVASELNYVPGGIFNVFCAEEGRRVGMEFVDFGDAYAHFFTVGAGPGEQFQVHNITRHGNVSRLDVVRKEFDAWLARGPDAAAALAEARRVIGQDRTAADPPPEALAVLERVRAHRRRGGAVACLFGHLTFDLGGLHDDGPAHRDMADWLDDTLSQVRDGRVLLLVKPHIAEGRYKANRRPMQLLGDLVSVSLGPNVVWLDPLWFNAHQLFPHIDVGLVWRSSVALELAIAGVPAIVAGHEAYYRRAVDLIYPTDRAHYHELLARLDRLRVPAGQGERAALLLSYIRSTFLPLPYVRRCADGSSGSLCWAEPELDRFLAEGDPFVDRACDVLLAD